MSELKFGQSRAIATAMRLARQWAPIPDTILILGEAGTGKTALAAHVHELSGRSGRFVKESASSIPDSLMPAILGGHRKGAFTGAVESTTGLIRAADRGTFFLDEIGDASHELQRYLRRVLDERSVHPVAELSPVPVDVRFILATNRDLESDADAGRFLRDLLDRIGHFWLYMPPLRKCRGDILTLADFFLTREATLLGRSERIVLDDEVRNLFRHAAWPGNVRELKNLCRFLAVEFFSADRGSRPIAICDLPSSVLVKRGAADQRRARRKLEAHRAREAVGRNGGNISRAARELGIPRRQVYRLLDPEV
jgi:DNA-binding NtrC family response regulator